LPGRRRPLAAPRRTTSVNQRHMNRCWPRANWNRASRYGFPLAVRTLRRTFHALPRVDIYRNNVMLCNNYKHTRIFIINALFLKTDDGSGIFQKAVRTVNSNRDSVLCSRIRNV
jgi:hypothetical protein